MVSHGHIIVLLPHTMYIQGQSQLMDSGLVNACTNVCCCCMDASCPFSPPMFVQPRVHMVHVLLSIPRASLGTSSSFPPLPHLYIVSDITRHHPA